MADAMRIAFADRAIWMGDADFAAVPAKGCSQMLSAWRGLPLKAFNDVEPGKRPRSSMAP